ncbi:hypothetical protein KIN20_035359 [Parelaphostrongylus tenuis]|uniref:Uncharacterized protein n=1 Tax=Parelaphostrongylus tenuis TaxID=148309 RepID=A0AAD5RB06_PARTN|nr:hypothetical protein KIN20_035359 [Parelaphostrongylus tenuis]
MLEKGDVGLFRTFSRTAAPNFHELFPVDVGIDGLFIIEQFIRLLFLKEKLLQPVATATAPLH